ncbi:MAG: hypothetical protein ACTHJQ_24905 [Rhizobiaceae bacterium]
MRTVGDIFEEAGRGQMPVPQGRPEALDSFTGFETVAQATAQLIVSTLFFIQRHTGEVAEWSKALPC